MGHISLTFNAIIGDLICRTTGLLGFSLISKTLQPLGMLPMGNSLVRLLSAKLSK